VKVKPNHIYVVPPNKEIEILHEVLCLSNPSGRQASRLPIDLFFRSLATDKGEKAVGIILSGNGSDGTLGLRAIKAEFGLTIVQDPNSAKFRGMPTSAIDAGIADFVLPPASMPSQLLKYAAYRAEKGNREGTTQKNGNGLNPIFLLLRSKTGHDFVNYKKNTIRRRIERRMNVHAIESIAQYTRYLHNNPQEVEMLFKELLIGVTSFFRDGEAFELLRSKIVSEILAGKSNESSLRFWVPGCSTGEEVYSLAMLLREAMDESQVNPRIQIFGTDIDAEAVDIARTGQYSANAAADLSPERRKRFFVKEGNAYRIKKEIREMAVFAVQNVIKDPPFTKLDMICCRNVLIYLDTELQKRIIPLFHYVLKPGGLLLLGSSETIGSFNDLFSLIDKKWKLFRRKNTTLMQQPRPFDSAAPPVYDGVTPSAIHVAAGRQVSVSDVAEKELLDKYAPPCVIVNQKGDILYTHGRTGKFLELAAGAANLNVHEMAREGLRLDLSAAMRKCNQRKKAVTLEGLQVRTNGGFQAIDLTVRPLRERDDQLGNLTLIVFREVAQKAAKVAKPPHPSKANSKRVAELEQELRFTQESLQTSIEEMETSNEELKSMNEELQSTNEELQSTNEELETSKEEMQSLNEELVTVNAELQGKVDEMSQLNNDMKNLLDSTHIATVFLDTQLRIKRFTPEATNVINLIASDIGRPLSHTVSNLEREDLLRDAQSVLETLFPKELVVKTKDLRAFLMRVMPYRTVDNHIEGVVMTFTDIRTEHLLEAGRDFALSVLEAVNQPLVVLDAQMRVQQASQAFYDTFALNQKGTEQRDFFELGNGHWNVPKLRELLAKILSENSRVEDFEVKHQFPRIGPRTLRVNARRIFHLGIGTDAILLAFEDIPKGARRMAVAKKEGDPL
jgi:two-component system CheB/CheR fusion protein